VQSHGHTHLNIWSAGGLTGGDVGLATIAGNSSDFCPACVGIQL